jgi:hypothetical protein
MLQYRTPDMVPEIKMERSKYLRHVIRMDEVGVGKNIFERKPEGVRKAEVPRLRRLEDKAKSCKLCSGGKMKIILNMHPS